MTKLLLVHPDVSRLGGIEGYFLKIRPHFTLSHESCGNSSRPGEKGVFSRIRRILGDYLNFWRKVSNPEVNYVHINPSLQAKMFYRDWVFLWLAKCHGKKTVVFFRGWDLQFQQKLDKRNGWIFRLLYGNADAFIVLSSTFKDVLLKWNIDQPIYQEVTIIEDEVFDTIQLEDLLEQRNQISPKQLLFPSRILRAKGIFTTLRALQKVQETSPETGLIVAGDGEDLSQARQLVKDLQLDNVEFTGIVSGDQKYDLFRRAQLLCFPTEHDEGFPNTIVESMAFGLPVLTRPVGGVKDFFIDTQHGFAIDSTDPLDFAKFIQQILNDRNRYNEIARNNNRYASDNFRASQAAKRLEDIYKSL